MPTQIIKLNQTSTITGGKIISDSVVVLCDTSISSFTVQVPVANFGDPKSVSFKNTGSNALYVSFYFYSKLYLYDTSTQSVEVIPGDSFDIINDPVSNKWYIDGGDYNRFGSTDNYTEIESDGTVIFKGNATVFEDLNFDPDRSGGPAATRPDDVTINNVVHKEFTSANNQLCGACQEIPHEYKLSTKIYPHMHIFLKNGESAGTTGVTFTFYWELRQTSGITSGSVALAATSAELTANPTKFDIYDGVGLTGPATMGAQIAATIARTGGDAGDVVVTTYGLHYEIDSNGSRLITTK